MKRIGLAVAAVVAMAVGLTPLTALAQAKTAAAPAAPAKLDAKTLEAQRGPGRKEAPAVIQSAGIPCTMTDARFIGNSKQKNAAGKDIETKVYEVACKEGLGYALIAAPGEKTKAYDCLTLADNASLTCQLPDNANPKQGFAQYLSGSSRPCTISDARAMGSNASGQNYYEVACKEGPGYIIKTPAVGAGGSAELVDCMAQVGTQMECKFTTKQQVVAWIGQFAGKAKRTCQVSDARAVGLDPKTGGIFYELGCGSQPGFMVLADKGGNVLRTIDCAKALGIAGGCQFTNAVQAQSTQAGLYTQLANQAGFPCTVSKYTFIGVDEKSKREVIELACANRPDGAIAMFGDTPAQSEIYDCVRAGALGQVCHLTSPSVTYPKYNAALAQRGKTTCKVSDARWIGRYTGSNTDLIETACADGLQGWVLEIDGKNNVKGLWTCSQAAGQGVKCVLPTNVNPKKG